MQNQLLKAGEWLWGWTLQISWKKRDSTLWSCSLSGSMAGFPHYILTNILSWCSLSFQNCWEQRLWRMCPRWRNHSLIPTVLWSPPTGRTAPGLEPGWEFTPFNSYARVSLLRYLEERRDTATSTEMGRWTSRLYIPLLCLIKKKTSKEQFSCQQNQIKWDQRKKQIPLIASLDWGFLGQSRKHYPSFKAQL